MQSTDRISYAAETVTFGSAAAAGSTGVNALDHAPILNLSGNKVGSYWGERQNLMMTYQNQATTLIGAVVETASSASVVITDSGNTLDKLFEAASGNRRYIVKVIDSTGGYLHGWIGDITVSGNAYTFPVHNAVTAGAQSWVGALGDFNGTAVRVEIYAYQSSFVWVTGTVLTREVALDEEKMETPDGLKAFYDSLANGDYAVNYRSGAVFFKKATTGTSDTCNYDSLAGAVVTVTGSGASATLVDDAAFTPGTSIVTPIGFLADETATDSVDEGDTGAARMTLDRKILTANTYKDDAVFSPSVDYATATGFLADDTATDSVDEGDIGIARMSLDRKQLMAGSYVDDTAFTPAGANSYVVAIGAQADETSPDSVDEGDVGAVRMTLTRFLKTSQGDLISGEDQTNNLIQVVEKPLAVSTYTPDLDTSAALEASSVTKATAGVLYGFSASNTNATGHWIQFFNSATVPADATVPILEFQIGAEGTASAEWPKGRFFSTGIAWCISSTNGTKTVAGATALNDVNYK